MKLGEDLKLTITRLEEATDHEGFVYLKAKGYHSYKFTSPKGNKMTGYDQFTSIKLRPINEEQFEAVKERLFSQDTSKPSIKIVCYDCDLHTNNIGGKICPLLEVRRFDFASKKLFKKKDLLNVGKENE